MTDEIIHVGGRSTSNTPQIHTDRIIEFLRRRLDPAQKPKCKIIGLAHLTPEGNNIIITRPLAAADREAQEVEMLDIALDVERAALANAETYDRPQRYAVIAYGPGDVVLGRHDMLLSPPASKMIGGETEPPTGVGVLAQSMRFSEASMRLLVMSQQQTMDRMADENDRLRRRCAELEDKHMSHIQATEELLSKKAERDMMIEDKRAERARLERLYSRVEQLVPAVLSKYGVEASSSAAGGIMGLLKELRPDQRVKMLELLDEDQVKRLYEAAGGALNGVS